MAPSSVPKIRYAARHGKASSAVAKFLSGGEGEAEREPMQHFSGGKAGNPRLAADSFRMLNLVQFTRAERRDGSAARVPLDDLLSQLVIHREQTHELLQAFSEDRQPGHFHERSSHLFRIKLLHLWAKDRGLPRSSHRQLAPSETEWADTTPFMRLIYIVLLAINDYIVELSRADDHQGVEPGYAAGLEPEVADGDQQTPPKPVHNEIYLDIPETFTALALMIERSTRRRFTAADAIMLRTLLAPACVPNNRRPSSV